LSTDTKYKITTEYGSGFIRQTLEPPEGEVQQVLLDLCDMQLQHALVALGWKLPKNKPRPERLPRAKKIAKAVAKAH
jgi:hypothetical protein